MNRDKIKKKFFFEKLNLKSFILPASGTIPFDFENFYLKNKSVLDCVVTKTITFRPLVGNVGNKIYVGQNYIFNSIGLRNPGLEDFKKFYLVPVLKKYPEIKIIVSVIGDEEEVLKVIPDLNQYSQIIGYEINFSCPNIKKETNNNYFSETNILNLLKKIRSQTEKKIFIKVSSIIIGIIQKNINFINSVGIDAITVSNSIPGFVPGLKKNEHYFEKIYSGMSGPAIKHLVLAEIYKLKALTTIPVIGCGGITTFKDVLDYFKAGAEMIQVGSANFYDENVYIKIMSDLNIFLTKNNFSLETFLEKKY
ncbi:hypothetical protein [Mycoplasma sp. SG1]|uniref:hypothetical protein n=1 Tax=Mycoplasma sp. SG1 TaxID=2810348 RepID=UPI002023F6DC|nr:hypothetical protein [Mycoplasma sp. SG1]URM52827.1 hypothetical protein JRW51_00575 [Mycoplasma sp. SG1]